jgi:hypothetical protein
MAVGRPINSKTTPTRLPQLTRQSSMGGGCHTGGLDTGIWGRPTSEPSSHNHGVDNDGKSCPRTAATYKRPRLQYSRIYASTLSLNQTSKRSKSVPYIPANSQSYTYKIMNSIRSQKSRSANSYEWRRARRTHAYVLVRE